MTMYLSRLGITSDDIQLIAANVKDLAINSDDDRIRLKASEILLNLTVKSIESHERLKASAGITVVSAVDDFNKRLNAANGEKQGDSSDEQPNGRGNNGTQGTVGGNGEGAEAESTENAAAGEIEGTKAGNSGEKPGNIGGIRQRAQYGEHEATADEEERGGDGVGSDGKADEYASTEDAGAAK